MVLILLRKKSLKIKAMKVKLVFIAFLFKTLSFAQIIPIPDVNFKNKLINASTSNSTAGGYVIDINNDDEIDVSEAQQITYLNVSISNISDITGIEHFTNLQHLTIQYNSISNINISSLTQLITLRCDVNNLSSINLSGLINLQRMNCDNNQITNLSLTGLNNLKALTCSYNQISTLNFSSNPLFEELVCNNNNLTQINIKNGINQLVGSASAYNDCWKTGNPNLATICVDASELANVQNHLNNCGTAQTINITSNCGLGNEEFAANAFLVYPNPSDNKFTIHFNNTISKLTKVEVFNLLNQKVYSDEISNVDDYELFLNNLPSGTYLLKVSNGIDSVTKKIIKN